jgi:hypothetical protein
MNAVQRKFLIEKIQAKVKAKISELEKQEKKPISLSAYMMHLVLSDKFELQPMEHIREAIKLKALNVSDGRVKNFLGDGDRYGDFSTMNKLILKMDDIFVIPEDRAQEIKETNDFNAKLDEQIKELKLQSETIEVRIMLASDKTLQKMINEIDDMGDISLIDTKIKLLNE